jgi:polysaccharide biosynthesis transport protein
MSPESNRLLNRESPPAEHHPGPGFEAPPPALSAAPGLGTLVQAFRRCWWVALLLGVLCGALAAAGTWVAVPGQYTTSISFTLTPHSPNPSLDQSETDILALQKNMTAIVKSPEILGQAMEECGFATRYGISASPDTVAKRLVVDFVEGPQVMRVTLGAEKAEAVSALLNALGKVFAEKVKSADRKRLDDEIVATEKLLQLGTGARDLPSLADQLNNARLELQELERKHNLDPLGVAAAIARADDEVSKTKTRLTDLQGKIDDLEAIIVSADRKIKNPGESEVSDFELEAKLQADPAYAEMKKDLLALDKNIGYARQNLIDGPRKDAQLRPLLQDRARIEGQIKALKDQLANQLGNTARSQAIRAAEERRSEAEARLTLHRREEERLNKQLPELKQEAERARTGNRRIPVEVQQKRDQVNHLEKQQDTIGALLAGLKGDRAAERSRAKVLTTAPAPTEKDIARPLKFSAGIGIGTFLMLVAGVCFVESQSRRISAADDIAQGLGLPVLATLPHVSSAARELVRGNAPVPAASSSGMTEAIDALRTFLLHAPKLDGARVILVTSAFAGEGKTTLAAHLAASMARAWRKTLLIDCDLRNPNSHKLFGVKGVPGFSEALRNEIEFEAAIQDTPISRLWVLPGGTCNDFALQALSQEGIEAVFERLKEEYDLIIIDSSPVLPVPDALQLAKHADAVIVSVLRDVSRIPTVYAMTQRLRQIGARLIGAVVAGDRHGFGYSYPYPRKKR